MTVESELPYNIYLAEEYKLVEMHKLYAASALSPEGRVVIPAAIRDALGLRAGDRVQFELLDSGELRLLTNKARMARVTRLMRPHVDSLKGSPVDELIADRRREAADD
jgi:AbrB family looped-hinge helix DNA binding protein